MARTLKFLPLACSLPLSLAAAFSFGQATEVTFVDGSYTELCSHVAARVGKPGVVNPGSVQLTGSRLAVAPLDICSIAIREEVASSKRAGNYNNRGVLHFSAGKLDDALADFDQAVQLQPELAAAHVNRGFTLVALQRWRDAVDAFSTGLELGSTDAARAHFNRAIAHEELGQVREAYLDYRTAAELAPEWEEPRSELSRFSVSQSGQ